MLTYPFTLKRDTNGTLLVTFPDVPEAITVGEDEQHAREQGLEALEAALEFYVANSKPIPWPSHPKQGQATITLPV